MDSPPIELYSEGFRCAPARSNGDVDLEEGIEETAGYRGWVILVDEVKKDWNKRITFIWFQTFCCLLVLHPAFCILGELSWLYIFESVSLSDLRNLVRPPYGISRFMSSATTLQILRAFYEKFMLELCIFLSLVFLLTLFVKTLRRRVNICALICSQVIVDHAKMDLEAMGFSAQSTCIADAEDIFLQLLQSFDVPQHSQSRIDPQRYIIPARASSMINNRTLYNPLFFVFFHCPLIAIVCFIKFSISTLPPGTFLFSLIFGVIYILALLAVVVIWSFFAFHRLPTAEDIWGRFVMDLNPVVHQV
ncbi:hypothetical protein GGU11DRAFT_554894 [Lentinula aff. detonsa]|nr:hypothetical protein GGU11DRAFT_554894 [Lentinula aff. detonsa]